MSISPYKTWIAGEVLTAADLNASFLQIINNARSLISPLTASLDMDGFELVMDADADSSLTADTDDRLDVRLGGFDAFRFDGTTASSVNGIDFVSAATTNPAAIQANGEAGAVVSLKDVGRLQFNSSTLTLSSGSVTGKRGFHLIAAESGTSDDFDTLATTNYEAGDVVYLQADSGDTIYVTTAGNFRRPMLLRDTRPIAVMWSGTKWELVQHGWVMLDRLTASASSQLDLVKGIGSGYEDYRISLLNLLPTTDASQLELRISDDAGATFKSGATDYEYNGIQHLSSTGGISANSTSQGDTKIIVCANNAGNVAGEGIFGFIGFQGPALTAFHHFDWTIQFYDSTATAVQRRVHGSGSYNAATAAISGVRLFMTSGGAATIASGSVVLWGLLQ